MCSYSSITVLRIFLIKCVLLITHAHTHTQIYGIFYYSFCAPSLDHSRQTLAIALIIHNVQDRLLLQLVNFATMCSTFFWNPNCDNLQPGPWTEIPGLGGQQLEPHYFYPLIINFVRLLLGVECYSKWRVINHLKKPQKKL